MNTTGNCASKLIYAGFWRRVVALVLDFSILFALLLPFFIINTGLPFSVMSLIDHWIFNLIWFITLIVFWAVSGASPGKLLVGCKIVKLHANGRYSEINFKIALLRALAYIVSALPMYIGFFWIAFNKEKRGFHDLILGTVVIIESENYEDIPLATLMAPFSK